MGVGNSFRIPDYLVAGSPMGLRRLMLKNNLSKGKEFNYFNVQFANGKWYAWYYDVEDEAKLLDEAKAGILNGSR